ncbi:SRPBCC family protein [Nocardioides sp. URHA0020]|uniref:SRPBCC family protein n=1 Tax=Nocardioides sp. URHA0020 TaxID=1380392 RepID=UPI00048B7D58|nr:SRPBCC family protein [Nocardioides sp. URHA0020]
MALPLTWGATPAEARRPYAADDLVEGSVLRLTRAISVAAPPELTWRWLCQIAVAPYSYDWIDNRGRRSPRTLTPGADRLVLGQRMAVVFELVSYDAPRHWTALTTPRGQRLFGPVAVTYAAEPDGAGSRIVCRFAVDQGGAVGWTRSRLLAWGDLVMMRQQLRTLKRLAEGDAAGRPGAR